MQLYFFERKLNVRNKFIAQSSSTAYHLLHITGDVFRHTRWTTKPICDPSLMGSVHRIIDIAGGVPALMNHTLPPVTLPPWDKVFAPPGSKTSERGAHQCGTIQPGAIWLQPRSPHK